MTERRRYTAAELRDLPTLTVGQADDLKIDNGTERIWLSRAGVEDGAPYDNQIFVETFDGERWNVVDEYPG